MCSLPTSALPVVELLGPEWLDAVCSLERECIPTSWSRASIAAEFERPESLVRGIVLGGVLVAYLIAYRVATELHILSLGVAPASRRQGLAQRLLRSVLEEGERTGVAEVFLEVRLSNIAAQRLYEGLGFRCDGIRRQYYSDNGEDAMVLRCTAPFLTFHRDML